jgi:hypothetical protein
MARCWKDLTLRQVSDETGGKGRALAVSGDIIPESRELELTPNGLMSST